MPLKNLAGCRFEKLLVLDRSTNSPDGSARWNCVCDCGERRVIHGTGLRAWRNKSCGCSSPKFTKERLVTHGMSKTRTYKIYRGMLRRCSDSARGKERKNYYDKGIRVCLRWSESFENFLADMGPAPEGYSIDRIDGNSWYEPNNCRWSTSTQQANNMSRNSIIEYNGRSQTIAMWAKEIGVKQNTLYYRISRGIPIDRAMHADIGFVSTEKKKSRERACLVCGGKFIPRTSQIRDGRGLFCSRACSGKRHAK